MFGDWNWKAMEQVSRITAAVWFWIFMLMIVMVMFNVLLAIVMDSYITVKKTAQNADSLYTFVTLTCECVFDKINTIIYLFSTEVVA